MTRLASAAVAILIVIGTGALYYGYTRGESTEWHAGMLPYPGAGFSTECDLVLHRGGRFELQVRSPAKQQEYGQEDRVPANLRVTLTRGGKVVVAPDIRTLRVGEWGAMERVYSSSDVWKLPGGTYVLKVTGTGAVPQVFSQRGAVVEISRLEPVGPGLGIDVLPAAGVFILAGAALIAAAIAWKSSWTA